MFYRQGIPVAGRPPPPPASLVRHRTRSYLCDLRWGEEEHERPERKTHSLRGSLFSTPHNGIRKDFGPDSGHLFVTLSVGTPLSLLPTKGAIDCRICSRNLFVACGGLWHALSSSVQECPTDKKMPPPGPYSSTMHRSLRLS